MDLETLAEMAKAAALAGENVKVDLPIDWVRPHGFAFPAIRPKVGDADGFGVWEWTPYAVLMFVFNQRKEEKNHEKTV